MSNITISPAGRILFDGSDYGSLQDCIANWPSRAGEIAQRHAVWAATKDDPTPVQTEAPANDVVSAAQAKIALHRAGLLETVERMIANADAETKIWYSTARFWRRTAAPVEQMALVLGLTSEKVQGLFDLAATIDV